MFQEIFVVRVKTLRRAQIFYFFLTKQLNFSLRAILNEICSEATKELLINDEKTPTKEEISKSISSLRCKLDQDL